MRNDTRSEIVMQLLLHEKEESVWYAELSASIALQEFQLYEFVQTSDLILKDCSPNFASQCGAHSAQEMIGQAINRTLFGQHQRDVIVLNDRNKLPHIVKFVSIHMRSGSIAKAYFNIVGLMAAGTMLNGMLGRRRDITQQMKAKEEREALADSFTTRELEIFLALAKGRTVKQIASAAGMMEKTVYFHIENIERKMNTCGILDIVQKAYRLGFMDSTEAL